MGDRLKKLRGTVDFLCSEKCAGRKAGSKEGAVARRWIAEQFERLDLREAAPGFVQPVPKVKGGNVVGLLPGDRERTILVAAHYDHLGRAPRGQAFWGADDNAAAVAILLDVAERLKEQALGRQVLFVAFDAEEPPHFMSAAMGSDYFVRNPVVPLESIDMMICMDLMGHAVGQEAFPDEVRRSVFALGAEKTEGTGALVDSVGARTGGVAVRRLGSDVIPPLSDYYAFANADVPYLFLTCGRWKHYHAVTDTPEKLDYEKMASAADFLGELVAELSHREDAPGIDHEARDDAASLASLRGIGDLLRPHVPGLEDAEPILDLLGEQVDRSGQLRPADRQSLSALVGAMESILE